jgi:hypothetical protein
MYTGKNVMWRISRTQLIRSAISWHWRLWLLISECVDVCHSFFNHLLCLSMLAAKRKLKLESCWKITHFKVRGLKSVSWFALEDPWTEERVSICIERSVDWTVLLDLHWRIRGLNRVFRLTLEDPWTEQRVSICIRRFVDCTACFDLHWKIRGLNNVAWFAL